MNEEWRTIPGFPLHECSTLGRIRRISTHRIIRGNVNRDGYIMAALAKGHAMSAHRFVYLTFVGQLPEGMHIAHKDGNPANNSLLNLMACTPKVNCSHKNSHGTVQYGERASSAKLTERDVMAIRRMRQSGSTLRSIAQAFGLRSDTSVLNIVNRKTWKHL